LGILMRSRVIVAPVHGRCAPRELRAAIRRHLDAATSRALGSEQPGIWQRFQMPAKNVYEPTQFDGIGAHGRSISIDLVSRPQFSEIRLVRRCAEAAKVALVPPRRQGFDAAWASYCEPGATPPQASKVR
jgi:hypothetical protein